MVFRIRRSRICAAPERDLTSGAVHEFMSLEEAVRAYLQGGAVSLPEMDKGEYEFDSMTPEDSKKGLTREQMRSDDIAPISLDRLDIAAGIEGQKYAELFLNMSDSEPAPADPEPNAE